MSWNELYDRAVSQHGIVTPQCVRTAGIPSATFYDRVNREGWRSPYPATYLLPGAELNHEARIRAAQLWVGGLAPAAAWTAAFLHGLVPSPPSSVQLWVQAPRNPRRHPQAEVRRSRTLTAEDVSEVRGIPTTNFPRTIVDLAASTDLAQLRSFVIDGRHRGQCDPNTLAAVLARNGNVPGHHHLVQIVHELAGDSSDSGFEFLAADRLADAGVPVDAQQVEVATLNGRRLIDLAYVPVKVGIECVGFAYHGSRDQFEADALRSNEIAELDDWLILRLTWRMFFSAWDEFLAALVRVLRRRGHPLPS